MEKLTNIKRVNHNVYFTNKSGTISFPLNLDYINYMSKVDLTNGTFAQRNEKPEVELPTINDLIASGELIEKRYVPEYTILLKEFEHCGIHPKRLPYKRIMNEFKEHGFNVTREAIEHNYDCWLLDMKSGYRSNKNGFHLFTPCGCNTLSFTASKLDEHFDWQETYYA